MVGRLDLKTAFVIGASSGIGRAVAERFAADGANVVAGSRSRERAETTAAAIRDDGGTAIAVDCDLTDQSTIDAAIETATAEFGDLNIVFNSAGAMTRGSITATDESEMERVLDVNLLGAMRLAKAAIPELAETDGTLINVSSEAGERGIENLPVYCASKGGLNTLTKQLAVEFGPRGVTVNAIAPGTTKTAINEEVRMADSSWVEERREAIPIRALNEPEDVAELAAYLASDEANAMNGAIVNIDGGTTAQ